MHGMGRPADTDHMDCAMFPVIGEIGSNDRQHNCPAGNRDRINPEIFISDKEGGYICRCDHEIYAKKTDEGRRTGQGIAHKIPAQPVFDQIAGKLKDQKNK